MPGLLLYLWAIFLLLTIGDLPSLWTSFDLCLQTAILCVHVLGGCTRMKTIEIGKLITQPGGFQAF